MCYNRMVRQTARRRLPHHVPVRMDFSRILAGRPGATGVPGRQNTTWR